MFSLKTTRRRGLLTAPASLIAVALLSAAPAAGVEMSAYHWQHRPLLLFAPQHSDARLRATVARLQDRRCEVDDRHMVIGVFVENGTSRMGHRDVAPGRAASLRDRYDIPRGGFAVLLIGKDGGEKYRLYEVPELDEIFGLIDGMPMRRNEMIATPANCG